MKRSLWATVAAVVLLGAGVTTATALTAHEHVNGAASARLNLNSSGLAICSARNLVVGGQSSSMGFSTVGTSSTYVRVEIRNSGANCRFVLPRFVQVQGANGTRTLVGILNAGISGSATIDTGRSRFLVIGSWWKVSGSRTPPVGVNCTFTIRGVNHLLIPIGNSWMPIQLSSTWNTVCMTPLSTSISLR